ncbi:hypothetical protein COCOBI_06-1230 [Coccomyxa sp. Obi]|nr:hypothetical protein COCOBI_06-1230 [Coccomyxa sp. Obi]
MMYCLPLKGVLLDAAAGPQVVDAAYIRHWIHYRYQACGFRRYLSDSDMKALLQQAGTHSGAGQVDPLCWESFRAWFSKGLKTLHQCARVWNMMKPHAICGFAVSRAAAEALLAEQPLGSFLVRLCSEPGAFAISCCMEGPGGRRYVDHLLIDAVDLQARNLEAWVQAHQFATQLLDPLADKVYPKAMIVQPPPLLPAVGFMFFKAMIFQPPSLLPTVGSLGMGMTPPAAAALPAAGSMQQPPPAPQPQQPARPPAQLQATPSNLSLDHLLMLANLTNSATDWSSTPLSSSPGMTP